jgi:protein-tyrosine phosphatase
VLFVCTGNICRSPIAERVARAYVDEVLGEHMDGFRLASAGTHAVVGSGVHPLSSAVLTALGGDPAGFAARQLTDDMAGSADLALGLTRSHRRAVLRRAPRGLSRTFTLLEAADLASSLPADLVLPGDTGAERCRSLVREMAAARARRGSGGEDDIADPIGESAGFHEQIGEAVADAVVRLFVRLVGVYAGAAPVDEPVLERSSAHVLTGR